MSLAVNLTPGQSEQLIYQNLVDANIPGELATLVTAQSGHETGGWISPVYINDNNAFGYGYDGVSSYKQYASVEDSVLDIITYLHSRVNDGSFPPLDQITDASQYAELLKNAKPGEYYTAPLSVYTAGIERWLNNNLGVIAIAAGGAGLLVVIILLGIALLSKK